MEHMGAEIYYLKEMELKLLLAGLGLKEWYGLFSDEAGTGEVPEGFRNRILADLYQKELIDWKQGSVAVRQPCAGMLSAMLEKKRCVTIKMPDENLPVRCCYLSADSVVMIQKSQREEKTLGMAQLPVPDWLQYVEEAVGMLEDGECLVLTCCSSENGRIYQRLNLWQEGLRDRWMEWKNGCIHCSREEFANKLKERLW